MCSYSNERQGVNLDGRGGRGKVGDRERGNHNQVILYEKINFSITGNKGKEKKNEEKTMKRQRGKQNILF